MTQPLVSVLMPCYNAGQYVGAAIQSALDQTWPNIEIIVVDDGSTDNSTEVIKRFLNGRVRLITLNDRGGAAAARNAALANAQGDFIQYLDADDLLSPTKIAIQVERLGEAPKAVATSRWGRFYASLENVHYAPEPTWADLSPADWISAAWIKGHPMHCVHAFLTPRAISDAAGPWNPELVLNEDGEYFTRVIFASERVLFCPDAEAFYRSGNPNSASRPRTTAHRESWFRSLHLCEARILEHEDSERMRRGLALAWQHLAHFTYPYDAGLAEHALGRARALHPVEVRPGGGPTFLVLRSILGWRAARKIQTMAGRP